ncbi:MAG: hypothetical protein H6631_04085 [Anaerolineaceae bacterium]|nr:hypothetical protein [Anaerolineaceae bacterium]
MTVLKISLFGTVQISHNDWVSSTKVAPKALALLSYLLLQGHRLHPREVLAQQLWQDYSEKQARSCLSTALWRLRLVLEPKPIHRGTYLVVTTSDEIGFNWHSNYWLDCAIFESQARAIIKYPLSPISNRTIEKLEETLRLYTGDLLESLYDDWAVREKQRLNYLYLDCLEYLMRYYRQVGYYERSLAYGQQILAQEPIREAIHREMIRLYLETGQRALAVRQYQLCQEILSQELGLEPMAETQALYDDARHGSEKNGLSAAQTNLQQAFSQLNLAAKGFDDAQQQLKLAQSRFDQAQLKLQRALQMVERLTNL